MSELSNLLKEHAKAIENDARFHSGKRQDAAKAVIRFYEMHKACPGDPGAIGLCQNAFTEWQKARAR